MVNVYFKKINSNTESKEIDSFDSNEVKAIARELLEKAIQEERIKLHKKVPLKVHFGEKGNISFIKPDNFDWIIDYLKGNKIESCFMETSAMYSGQRYKKDLHLKTAKEHGFTQLPIIIADGDQGENFAEVEINKNHFKICKIGKDFFWL